MINLKVSTEEEQNLMRQELHKIISQAIANNKMWTFNWNVKKIPKIKKQYQNVNVTLGKRIRDVSEEFNTEFLNDSHKEKRVKRFDTTSPQKQPTAGRKPKFLRKKENFKKRGYNNNTIDNDGDIAMVGTCTMLEKDFYRQITVTISYFT